MCHRVLQTYSSIFIYPFLMTVRMSVTLQEKTSYEYVYCVATYGYFISTAWEWKKNTFHCNFLYHYLSAYLLIKRQIAQEDKQRAYAWAL